MQAVQITNNKQQITNNKQQITNNKQQTTNNKIMHIPVLKKELIEGLNIAPGGHYLDATVGFGGHSSLMLATYSDVKVTAMDRDESALAAAQERLIDYESNRLSFWQGNFADYQPGSLKFDGIIADLGVNSAQLDIGERGFSFQHAAKLDMRMDRSQSLTAEKIINHLSERELGDIFYQYGEERFSRRIAKRIVERRPFYSTTDLAGAIASSFPPKYRYGKIHPATRVFQALRIYVNQELESLEKFIATAPQWLKVGGVMGIISFHSLEDRIVKHGFRQAALLEVLTKKTYYPGGGGSKK